MSFVDTITAKSNQLNSDDLLGGPIVIKITEININEKSDQPVSIHYVGDNNKPYKPSKTMRRVMVIKWGINENAFIGRSMRLYRDPTITWAGKAVGGIAISHMSNIENEDRMMLTASRGQKKAIKIELLLGSEGNIEDEKLARAKVWVSQAKTEISEVKTLEELQAWHTKNKKVIDSLDKYDLSNEFNAFYESVGRELLTK